MSFFFNHEFQMTRKPKIEITHKTKKKEFNHLVNKKQKLGLINLVVFFFFLFSFFSNKQTSKQKNMPTMNEANRFTELP